MPLETDSSSNWIGPSRPGPTLIRHPTERLGQILRVSFRANSVGLFQLRPPSTYVMPSMVIGEKNLGVAEVARLACQIVAGKASLYAVSYVRINTGLPEARARVVTTNVLHVFAPEWARNVSASRVRLTTNRFISCSKTRWLNSAGPLFDLELKIWEVKAM